MNTLFVVGDIQINESLLLGNNQDAPSLMWIKDRHATMRALTSKV
ncbi:hypothetical protein RHD99_14935 [Buttiauxella selenatireducens]|uniref:Uncharacterized protein n=1 Tax=Buttiauxella selenatireducens TaxID=3073902 RepID=A0ABY9S5I0_9ENTR|nr:hypothetical protein [Buttiauxella sp. R73]WMY72766.1 hypothetical protein RHD99_14935 [Buttiauxella sp. R73]